MLTSRTALTGAIVLMVGGAGSASAQSYPVKPIRIVTASVGGGPDFSARIIAQGLASTLGQHVVVDNRGGSVTIMAEIVAKSPPDGYTFLLTSGAFWLEPLMRDKSPYDPLRDFAPVTLATTSPTVLVLPPSVAANSVKELIALAKAKPGALNYASGPAGSTSHLSAELFKAMAGADITRVFYQGTGPALIDVMSGRVQLMFSNVASAAPHIKSGRLKALAVTSAQPSALFPGLPTVAASALPGYESAAVFGMFVTAKTPASLINRLNQEVVRVLNRADTREKHLNFGVETVGSSPEQLAATIKSEVARLGRIIREAGLRSE